MIVLVSLVLGVYVRMMMVIVVEKGKEHLQHLHRRWVMGNIVIIPKGTFKEKVVQLIIVRYPNQI